MTHETHRPTPPQDDLLAKAMASALDQSTGALPSRITARLAQMREQALAHQKHWQTALQLAGHGTHRAIGADCCFHVLAGPGSGRTTGR
jgi:hypothetical protein